MAFVIACLLLGGFLHALFDFAVLGVDQMEEMIGARRDSSDFWLSVGTTGFFNGVICAVACTAARMFLGV